MPIASPELDLCFRFCSPQIPAYNALCDHGCGASASRGVPVYAPAFAGVKLYWLVTGAHGQLAQSRYAAALGRGSNSRPLDWVKADATAPQGGLL